MTTSPTTEVDTSTFDPEDATPDAVLEVFRSLGFNDPDTERLYGIINEIVAGERTLDDVEQALIDYRNENAADFGIDTPPVTIGDSVIPAGGRLVEVLNPEGADAGSLYRVVYEWNGVEYSYEIGDQARFDELFGASGVQGFSSYTKVDQGEWDESGIFVVGNIDERLGSSESEASLMERELRALGHEQMPAWWDDEVKTIMVIAAGENWSAGRIANELKDTEAFQGRFPALNEFMEGRRITDLVAATGAYAAEEQQLAAALRRVRGPDTDISTEYLGTLIGTGWTAQEISPILNAEKVFLENPAALDELNSMLAFSGLEGVGLDGFVDVMIGAASNDVYEVINDTLRKQALAEAGVDIDVMFAESLGDDVSTGIADPSVFTAQAQQAAAAIARNARNLDLERFGLDRDDLVAAVFGEGSPTGKTSGEITSILKRLEAEATASASGISGSPSFIDAQGRLRIQGFGSA